MEDNECNYLRRDNEPDRASLLLLLGVFGIVLGVVSCLVLPGILGLALGLAVQVMAARDLAKMDSGLMDTRGRMGVQTARTLGFFAATINGYVLACYVLASLVIRCMPGWGSDRGLEVGV